MAILKTTLGLLTAMTLTSAAALLVGCSSQDLDGPNGSNEPAGTIGLALQAAPGFTLNTVSYAITGPSGFTKTGTIDVSNSTKITALIGSLPAGKGFTITLSANAVGGVGTCTGSASFDIVAKQTTPVTIGVTCREAANRTGSVLINGVLNVCPAIDGVSASPAEVMVGGSIALSAAAHDGDKGPKPLTYRWKASADGLSDDSVANPTFTCKSPGTVKLSVTVSDSDPAANCTDSRSLTVECSEGCASYNSITAALGELTADCRGTINPNDYIIGPEGRIAPAFDSCPLDANDPQRPRMVRILQLLSVQRASDLPNVLQCTAGRFQTLKAKFDASGISQCPTWSDKKVLNPPTAELIKTLSPLLPNLEPEGEPVTLKEPWVAPPALDALKIKSTYSVKLDVGNQKCGTPAQCAAACAEVFPGFVVPSIPGVPASENVITVDPDSWWSEELYSDRLPDPNNMNAAFYHQMGFVLPTPGQKYGAQARWNPCSTPVPPDQSAPILASATVSSVCVSEKCNFWAGGSVSNPSYIKVKLQQWCIDYNDPTTCLSYCGTKPPPPAL